MSSLEQVQADIQNLPEEAQSLLIDFIALLKKRYAESGQTTKEGNTYQKFKDSGFIGCASVEEDLSATYKQVLAEQWNKDHDPR